MINEFNESKESEHVIIIRKNILAELFAAHLLIKYKIYHEYILTDHITSLTEDILKRITGKNVLIFGGYYQKSLEPILAVVKTLAIVLSESTDPYKDAYKDREILQVYQSPPCTYALQSCNVDDIEKQMSLYIDDYLYGQHPNDEAMNFQQGIYDIDKPTDLEKLLSIQNKDDIQLCLENGAIKRLNNQRQVKWRIEGAVEVKYEGKAIMVSEGDYPVVDTCYLLAKLSPDGIGLAIRHHYKLNKTFLSVCCLKENAGELIKKLMNQIQQKYELEIGRDAEENEKASGGGSPFMGGGSCYGLYFYNKIFEL
jgi:hypothetical protein